jgi:hypothetical protein
MGSHDRAQICARLFIDPRLPVAKLIALYKKPANAAAPDDYLVWIHVQHADAAQVQAARQHR